MARRKPGVGTWESGTRFLALPSYRSSMTDAEWVLAIGSIALVGATLGLVYATLRLSSFTKALSSATQEAARIDERRTRMEQRRARLQTARRRVALGEELIRMHRTDWLVSASGRFFP